MTFAKRPVCDNATPPAAEEIANLAEILDVLAEDGTTFAPLTASPGRIPQTLAKGVWQALAPTLDGEQWLFDLGCQTYAVTTRGRVIKALESTMSIPCGYAILSLRASGSSHSLTQPGVASEINQGPCMRIVWPRQGSIRQFVANLHYWQSVAYLVPANLCETLKLGRGFRTPDTTGAEAESDLVAIPAALIPPICEVAAVKIRDAADLLSARGLLLSLLAKILAHPWSRARAPTRSDSVSPSSMRQVMMARAAVERTLASPPSQRRLARLIGTDERKLNQDFKTVYGVSPAKFGRASRLDWARSLLLSGEISITQVAATVGFADVTTFSRAFRNHFGASPRQTRSSASQAHALAAD